VLRRSAPVVTTSLICRACQGLLTVKSCQPVRLLASKMKYSCTYTHTRAGSEHCLKLHNHRSRQIDCNQCTPNLAVHQVVILSSQCSSTQRHLLLICNASRSTYAGLHTFSFVFFPSEARCLSTSCSVSRGTSRLASALMPLVAACVTTHAIDTCYCQCTPCLSTPDHSVRAFIWKFLCLSSELR